MPNNKTIEWLAAEFLKFGEKLISTEYKGYKPKYQYECKGCGNKNCFITIARLRLGETNCKACWELKRINTNLKKYGVPHPTENKDVQAKIRTTCLERYGGHPCLTTEVKAKIMHTNIERYGVPHANQNPQVKQKYMKTNLERYGFANAIQNKDVQAKRTETNIERYGVSCSLENEQVKEKKTQTNLKRYGVPHYLQTEDGLAKQQKSACKRKPYLFIRSNYTAQVQGYEPFALDLLLEQGIQEEDLIKGLNSMPKIWYTGNDSNLHRYYPDIFVPSQNKIIEVKSQYTFDSCEDITLMKAVAVQQAGYTMEIQVFDKKGNLIRTITDFSAQPRSEASDNIIALEGKGIEMT